MSETARTIRGDRVPVVDTWRQTEIGGIMIAPLPGLTVLKPGSGTKPLPGIGAALVDHPAVAEAAVVAKNDPETGQAISAFVTLRTDYEESTELIAELRNHVGKLIGPIARPKWIAFTPDPPKTRSGKITRRLLRDIAENRQLGDTTTLADATIVADLQRRATEEEAKEQ